LRSIRGIGDGTVRRYSEPILAAVARGAENPPPRPGHAPQPLSARAQIWTAIVNSLVQAICVEEKISSRFVATRSDAEAVADWFDRGDRDSEPDIDLLKGWRRELAGGTVLAWLRGEITLTASATRAGVLPHHRERP
jgi:ribonuclease D